MIDTTVMSTVNLLFKHAERMGLHPTRITEKGLFAISVNGKETYVHYARSPFNSHVATSLTTNKYLTRLVLERHGLNNVPFIRFRTLEDAIAFLEVHKKVIVKPLKGQGSQEITIVTHPVQFAEINMRSRIVEKYIPGKELRYLVLNQKVIAVHHSDYGVSVAADRALKRISYPEHTWDASQVATAIRITEIMNLNFAAVDFIVDERNIARIIEVNSCPGLKWFHSPSSGPPTDVAGLFMSALIENNAHEKARIN